jgi:diguanylate cyclase (GGDEF)-like protein/PAS domain S-box-containing protein
MSGRPDAADGVAGDVRPAIRFFSLRWKLLGSLVLLSFATFVLLSQFFRLYLLERYENARHTALPLYSRQINGLIRQERRHLEQVAMSLPTLSGSRTALAENNPQAFKRRFDDFWSSFQLDMGLEDAYYFDAEGNQLQSWNSSLAPHEAADGETWRQALKASSRLEAPSSFISCVETCRLYALAPVLVNGRLSGQFAVGVSLAEVVLAFHNTSNADVAIITAVAPGEAELESDDVQSHWQVRVQAASNPRVSLEILKQASARSDLPAFLASAELVEVAGKSYEVAEMALAEDSKARGMRILLIKDVSLDLAQAKETAYSALLLSLSGGALSLGLLYVLLGKSLNRLLRTARSIPLLGRGAFAELRAALNPRRNPHLHDEIDMLDSTAVMLSWRLQSLETKVEERTCSLQSALDEVYEKSAFVSSLLDHAQVIIVTHDEAGKAISINRYGCELTGYTEAELRGEPLLGSPLLLNPRTNLNGRLKELASGKIEHLRHEASLRCFDASQRDISWVHTRLTLHAAGGAATLLAVGLDISERKQNEARLAYLADHDPLTGCYNRRRFVAEMERLLLAASDSSRRGCLLFIDLDHFKFLNDTSGHHAGDSLLLLVTDELRKLIRPYDILGRLGGDEFAVGVLDSDEHAAIALAEKINAALSALTLPSLGIKHPISASIGIAMFPDGGFSVRDLLVHADIAMYQAKDKGRKGWHVFSPDEKARERLHEWLVWEQLIKRSMAEDTFELYFQPVMLLSTRGISHFEILLRMRMPDGSVSTPVQLLDIAERSNLIRELDLWVVRKAIAYIADLPHEHDGNSFTINLSGVSIGDKTLLENLKSLFETTDIDPRRIIFEITETAAVADLTRAREFVIAIKAIGCCFALDDFGSGFSSFYYLKHFPVDYVKIDGSFIFNLADSLDDQILVRAMADIAKAYNKKSVAEFVEDENTLKILEQYGVDYVQGFYIGKPLAQLSMVPDYLPKGEADCA